MLYKYRQERVYIIKRLFIPATIILFVLIICYPSSVIYGAKSAIDSWLFVVTPALLPFMIAALLFVSTGTAELIGNMCSGITRKLFGFSGGFAYVFVTSCLSGYPMGARLTSELYMHGEIEKKEAESMLLAASTASPLFMTGAIATGLLGDISLSVYILIPHYLSALIIAIYHGRRLKKTQTCDRKKGCLKRFISENPLKGRQLGAVISEAVANSMQSILMVGGLMILFGVAVSCLEATGVYRLFSNLKDPASAKALIAGFLEMTTGCIAAADSTMPLILCSAIVSFGGLSIQLQTRAVAAQAQLKAHKLFPSKLAQGVLSGIFCAVMLALMPTGKEVFAQNILPKYVQPNWTYLAIVMGAFFVYLFRRK